MLVFDYGTVIGRKVGSIGLVLIMLLSACTQADDGKKSNESTVPQRPNILLIVADDLGYSDLGAYGGEIATPNLDQLANSGGVKFTNFHVAPTCSPTRSMLMSGTYSHKAGLGAMAEWAADNQRGKPGYEGYLNHRVVSLPALLRDAGYQTFMAGKWHLGMEPDQGPDVRGFDYSFAMLPGAGNHYTDQGLMSFLPVIPYRENGKAVKLPKQFYSTEFYTDKAIENIDKARAADKPFFGYVAYTAPHWPLQVPAKYSDKYRGVYDQGYASIKQNRLKNLLDAGLISAQQKVPTGTACYKTWNDLAPEERKRQARVMEIYAGMVDALDENIGRLLSHLKRTGEFDNTLIMFVSDNGADARPESGGPMEAEFVAKNFDNSMDNLGAANSFVSYGGGWAEVGSTPFRLHKGMTTEGGIRVPAIIHFPGHGVEAGIRHQFMSVMDILPTFLDVAGAKHPGTEYKGRAVLPVTGKSMLPYLKGQKETVHEKPLYGFSVHRRQGLQHGKWKVVRLPPPYGDGEWELYNIDNDPGETRNLASSSQAELNTMIERWQKFAAETGVIISAPGSRSPTECAQ